MSLIGIDVGTSSLKVAAYREDGNPIASVRAPVHPRLPRPGWSELDPGNVWRAAQEGLARIGATPGLQADPPIALAISASGDEVFPVDAQGHPLGPCILSGDTRGSEIEAHTVQRASAHEWYQRCGHIPERMDPVNRILWWRANHDEVLSRTARFLGWHEYLTWCLCGRAVIDPSLAAKWLIFDLKANGWSDDCLRDLEIDPQWLPQVQTWGSAVGEVLPAVRSELALPRKLVVGVGAFDASCAALGAGASRPGTAGLACGSWEVVVAPSAAITLTPTLVESQFPVVPHPGEAALAVLAQSPNGSSVVDWIAQLVRQDAAAVGGDIEAASAAPSPVLAISHLSGSINPQSGGRDSRAALVGMTLATTSTEVIQALMESVAYDLCLTQQLLADSGVGISTLRAAGGGTRSSWWMQLKADLTNTPVEVVEQPEPGTFGAALLAGAAVGIYGSAGLASEALVKIERRYEPDEQRRSLHAERMAAYWEAVAALLPLHRRLAHD